MTSEALAKLYAEVVKVRPEAEVELQPPSNTCPDWWREKHSVYISHDLAEAIILHHWLSMLPPPYSSLTNDDNRWRVTIDNNGWDEAFDWGSTPLEALAAYLKSTGTEDHR